SRKPAQLPARGQVPHPDAAALEDRAAVVPTVTGSQQLAVRREGERARSLATLQLPDFLARRPVPKADGRGVPFRRGQRLAVRGKGDDGGGTQLTRERGAFLAPDHIPEPDHA